MYGRTARRWSILALLPCLAFPLAAQLEPREKGSLELVADRSSYLAGEGSRVAAVLEIEEGWHVNSHRPTFEYLIPTEVDFQVPEGWPEAEVRYPRGEMKRFGFAEEPISVYEGMVSLVGELRIPEDQPSGPVPVTAELTYQACDDRSCLPPVTTSARVELRVGNAGTPQRPELFADAEEGTAPPAAASRPTPSLPLILLLGFLGGLILNAMPCVLPVLSLKVFGLVKSAGLGRAQVVTGGLATAAGILLCFWLLAGAAIAARSAGAAVGWGVQFQEPAFVAFLTVVVVLFCLNLWGLFEITLPGTFARLAGSGPREGIPGHLTSGAFATLMATPCSAPFLGTAVAFALGQPAATVLAVFTAVGLGMALPYLALAMAPGTARLLPRPGPWMGHLKVVMGFLLAGAAVWLLYVLAAQVSPERLALVQLCLLGLALFLWVRGRATGGRLSRALATAAAVAVAVLTLVVAAGAEARTQRPETAASLIEWRTFDRREAESLAREGRLVFVDVTADWCFTCKVNERLVLETRAVAEAFQEHDVVAMKADWTNRSDAIARYLADHGRYGIPFYLLYRPDAEPHLFSELLTRDEVLSVLEASGARQLASGPLAR